MILYRRKSREVTAILYEGVMTEKIKNFLGDAVIFCLGEKGLPEIFYDDKGYSYIVKSPVGELKLFNPCYVVKNEQGEYGVYDKAVFELKYEPVDIV